MINWCIGGICRSVCRAIGGPFCVRFGRFGGWCVGFCGLSGRVGDHFVGEVAVGRPCSQLPAAAASDALDFGGVGVTAVAFGRDVTAGLVFVAEREVA